MKMQIMVPNEFTGDIIGDLNTKRARVLGMNQEGDTNTIEAESPMAEVLRYATDLKSITQGVVHTQWNSATMKKCRPITHKNNC